MTATLTTAPLTGPAAGRAADCWLCLCPFTAPPGTSRVLLVGASGRPPAGPCERAAANPRDVCGQCREREGLT